jgi:hypothetical protein
MAAVTPSVPTVTTQAPAASLAPVAESAHA